MQTRLEELLDLLACKKCQNKMEYDPVGNNFHCNKCKVQYYYSKGILKTID